jgi:lysozyme family protein
VARITRGPEFSSPEPPAGAEDRYLQVAAKTECRVFVIAVILEREASQRWGRSIAQSDRWNRESVYVPAGCGSFKSFEEAAYDTQTELRMGAVPSINIK